MVCLVGLFAERHGVCQEALTLKLFTCVSRHLEERPTEGLSCVRLRKSPKLKTGDSKRTQR